MEDLAVGECRRRWSGFGLHFEVVFSRCHRFRRISLVGSAPEGTTLSPGKAETLGLARLDAGGGFKGMGGDWRLPGLAAMGSAPQDFFGARYGLDVKLI